jgi:CheY-like chemotaxis protein
MNQILIVEDNASDSRRISDIAREYGVPVSVNSTAAAMDLLQSRQFGAVVLDLLLGDGTAENTLQAFSLALTRTPVVVVTGLENEALKRQAELLGWSWVSKESPSFCRLLQRALDAAMEREDSTGGRVAVAAANQLDAILAALKELKAGQGAMADRLEKIESAVSRVMVQMYGDRDPLTGYSSGGCVQRHDAAMRLVSLGRAWMLAAVMSLSGLVAGAVSWLVSKVTQ